MMKYNTVLFDLDGTLIDPKIGITTSVQFALKKMGITIDNIDELEFFIGPPLQLSFKEHYGFTDDEVTKAIEYYRERYKPIGIYENTVYEGILSLLVQLKEAGCQIAIATSKPTIFAQKIAEHYNFHTYFDAIIGSELDGTRTLKAEVVTEVLQQLGNPNVASCVMIGDRKFDIIGGATNNMDTIGVTYGYGTEEELQQANSTYIVHSVEQLAQYLLK